MRSWRRALTQQLGLSNRIRPSFRPLLESLEDRTTPTTLTTIVPSLSTITDVNAPGSFTMRLLFSGQMNTNITPTITFPTTGENPGGSLAPANFSWASTNTTNDTFVANFATADQNILMPSIDVRVSGAVDFANSAVSAITVPDVFSIDTQDPIVSQLNVNFGQITASNVGQIFVVTVTYRDTMQITTNPTIAFSPSVASTLTFRNSSWSADHKIYTATYMIGGTNNVIPSVNVTVTGAKNVPGFTQLPFTGNNVFSINTTPGVNPNAGFPVGSSTRLTGDFNGDGLSDVAAYYPSSGALLVALSTGNSFLTPKTWLRFAAAGTSFGSLMVGDFNHDGKADVAYFYHPSGTAIWGVAKSTGAAFTAGAWSNLANFGTGGWVRHVVGDFNNDGFMDVASFQKTLNVARWIVNISTGTTFTKSLFADLKPIFLNGWTKAVAGDFNGDGKTDIANFYNLNGVARWYVSLSNGVTASTTLFGSMPNAGVWTNQMAGDFNNDGKDDLVSYNSTLHQWWVSLSTGTAFTTTDWLDGTTSGAFVQTVADYNHDGKDDLSILDLSTGQLIVGVSTGTNFAVSVWALFPSTSLSLASELVGDFNGDGKPDIAHFFTNSSTTQWWVSIDNVGNFTTTRWR